MGPLNEEKSYKLTMRTTKIEKMKDHEKSKKCIIS